LGFSTVCNLKRSGIPRDCEHMMRGDAGGRRDGFQKIKAKKIKKKIKK
jgi:hypothetical protein